MQETKEMWVWSLGQEDLLEEGMKTHFSVLAWKIPWTEKLGGLQSMGSQSQVWLKWLSTDTPGLSCGMFSCSMQDLVLPPGMKPRTPALGTWSCSHWTTGKLPETSFALIQILFFYFLFFAKDLYYLNVEPSLPILNICHFQIFCLSSYVQIVSQFFFFLFIFKAMSIVFICFVCFLVKYLFLK